MDEEYEWEMHANESLNDLKEFIDTENQFIKKEHELRTRLLSLDYVILHLDERNPEDNNVADSFIN